MSKTRCRLLGFLAGLLAVWGTASVAAQGQPSKGSWRITFDDTRPKRPGVTPAAFHPGSAKPFQPAKKYHWEIVGWKRNDPKSPLRVFTTFYGTQTQAQAVRDSYEAKHPDYVIGAPRRK